MKLPKELAQRTDAPLAAKVMYAVLRDRARWKPGNWPGVRGLAKLAGLSRFAAQQALRWLAEQGMVDVSTRGACRSAEYVVYDLLDELAGPRPASLDTQLAGGTGQLVAGTTGQLVAGPGRPVVAPLMKTPERVFKDRERAGFSSASLRFREKMRKEKHHRVTDDQLWQLDPAFVEGVPFDLVWDIALPMWFVEPPWEVRRKAILDWRELQRACDLCHVALAHGMGEGASRGTRERIKRYARPELLAYAKGESHDAAREGRGFHPEGEGEKGRS